MTKLLLLTVLFTYIDTGLMSKAFKYQNLMNEKGVPVPCPNIECDEIETDAYRWSYSEEIHPDNFLPAFPFNEKIGRPSLFNTPEDFKRSSCIYCSLSMWRTLKEAKFKYNEELPYRTRELLKFTHVLYGKITKDMGVCSKVNKKGHFEFFEYADRKELKEVFVIHDVITD